MYDGWRYYHTVLQRARWDKPLYLGSLDIVHTAPTYAVEQAAIMVQGVWRKRQGWKMLMAAMASVWSKTVVWRKRQGWKMLMAAMASVWSKTVDPSLV